MVFFFHDRTATDQNIETKLRLEDFPSPEKLRQKYKKYKGIENSSLLQIENVFMIKVLFLVLFALLANSSALGQMQSIYSNEGSKLLSKANITLPDTASNGFFRQYSQVKQLWIIYRNNRAVRITPLAEPFQLGRVQGESYDLEYEGDKYAFEYKYGRLNFVMPKKEIFPAQGKKVKGKIHEVLQAFVSLDSIQYQYEKRLLLLDVNKIDTIGVVGRAAEYLGNLQMDRSSIEKLLLASPTSKLDSIIVFSFKVDEKGLVSELQLEAGKQSYFSDIVERQIFYTESGNLKKWRPAVIYTSGRNVISRGRVYARLNNDGHVYLSATPRLFRFLAR